MNFFFTSCPTICPTTTLNLIELQNKINKYEINNFKIISVSVDPENDTPQKLKEYAMSMNIDLSNFVLTGSQQEIYDLVKSGFSLSVGQDSLALRLFLFHSSSITIVDDEGYLRTGIDKKEKQKICI